MKVKNTSGKRVGLRLGDVLDTLDPPRRFVVEEISGRGMPTRRTFYDNSGPPRTVRRRVQQKSLERYRLVGNTRDGFNADPERNPIGILLRSRPVMEDSWSRALQILSQLGVLTEELKTVLHELRSERVPRETAPVQALPDRPDYVGMLRRIMPVGKPMTTEEIARIADIPRNTAKWNNVRGTLSHEREFENVAPMTWVRRDRDNGAQGHP